MESKVGVLMGKRKRGRPRKKNTRMRAYWRRMKERQKAREKK